MILNIYKEKGWTSFDVVKKVRNILRHEHGKKEKVGHAGTLDPLAEGVLIVLTGRDTKKQAEIMEMEKEYVAEISFGASSPTYDLEGTLSFSKIPDDLDVEKKLDELLPKYLGEIKQTVPPHSAVKVKGKRLYKKARSGKLSTAELPSKKITIRNITKLDFYKIENLPTVKLKISCSKGTYIRSLAHDLGKDLDVGGVLISLVRTRVGDYLIEQSKRIPELKV